MGDEQQNARSDLAKRDVSFFLVMDFIPPTQSVRILKGDLGSPEIDAVLREILPILPFIVLKTHSIRRLSIVAIRTYICQYRTLRSETGIT